MADNAPRKHHYVPKCYLKGWAGADGLLCDYRRPVGDVVVRRRHPSETGWIDKLYTLQEVAGPEQDVIEREFFKRVDQDAADVLAVFRRGKAQLSAKLQVGWARFVMSLIHRHPSQLERLREMAKATYLDGIEGQAARYAELRGPEDPESFAEFRAATDEKAIAVLFAMAFQRICESERIGMKLLSMKQQIVSFRDGERLITSDRPLLRGEGLDHPQALVMLPIGPRQLFVATNGVEAGEALKWLTNGAPAVPIVNRLVARQAFRHVYGVCENHMPLVTQEMSKGLEEPWRLHAG